MYSKWHYWNRSQHNGWVYEVIEDVGSGLNYQKKGLRQLITRICSGEIERLVITHKDRLLRFGSELVSSLCGHFGTEVVTVFSARLYGSRSHENRKVMDELRNTAQVAP